LNVASDPHIRPFIVGLGGTIRPNSTSEKAVRFTLAIAEELGARTAMFDGASLVLPLYEPGSSERTPKARSIISALRAADGVVIGSPGYHGSVSGMIKNALDYTEDMRDDAATYLDGRAVGCIACSSGWQAAGSTLAALRSIVHALRGWPTPVGVAFNSNLEVFDAGGHCTDENIAGQLRMIAQQLVAFSNMRTQTLGHREKTDCTQSSAAPIRNRA
jgi:FMN reductase